MKTSVRIFSAVCFFALSQFSVQAFSDLDEQHPAYGPAAYFQSTGVVEGYEDGTFRPNNKINRAEFLKIILETARDEGLLAGEIAGADCFKDVNDQWFAAYVCTAESLGYVDGYDDGYFRPEQPINFVEAAKIVANVLKVSYSETYIETWFEKYVVAMQEYQAIPLSVLNFNQNITRGEMAEMAYYLAVAKSPHTVTYSDLRKLSEFENVKRLAVVENEEGDFYLINGKVYQIELGVAKEVAGIMNPDKFMVLGGKIYADGAYTYRISGWNDPLEAEILDVEIDLNSFELLYDSGPFQGYFWGKDKDRVFYGKYSGIEELEGADSETFILFNCRMRVCGADKSSYYYVDSYDGSVKDVDLALDMASSTIVGSEYDKYGVSKSAEEYNFDNFLIADKNGVYFFREDGSLKKVQELAQEGLMVQFPDDAESYEGFYSAGIDYFAFNETGVWVHNVSTDEVYMLPGAKSESFIIGLVDDEWMMGDAWNTFVYNSLEDKYEAVEGGLE